MLTKEMVRKCKQLPKWRNFYVIGPGRRLLDFGYVGPAEKSRKEIRKFDKIDYMETIPSVSSIINKINEVN